MTDEASRIREDVTSTIDDAGETLGESDYLELLRDLEAMIQSRIEAVTE